MSLYSSAQYSVYLVRISWASVSQFPFLPCMVLACPCFVLAKTFNSWYAFSLTFFLMLPTIPWQCRSIQDSFFSPFFVIFLFSWFIILTVFDPFPLSYVFSSSVSFARHKYSICQLWPTVFWLLGVCQRSCQLFSHCCIEGVIYIENGNRCLLCLPI